MTRGRYEFYFAYCEAGFANGLIHDYQIAWRKSHLAAAKPARVTPQTGAEGTEGDESGDNAPLDTVTAIFLCIWLSLVVTLVISKRHMALIFY